MKVLRDVHREKAFESKEGTSSELNPKNDFDVAFHGNGYSNGKVIIDFILFILFVINFLRIDQIGRIVDIHTWIVQS